MNFINQLLESSKKRKFYSSFKDNIWGCDLADMRLIAKHNKGIRYILCVIDLFSKYAWVEGKSLVAERFIRTLKNKIYKHLTAISKNVSFDALDDIVNKYNNTYHKTIKMKPVGVGDDSFAEYNEKSNEKDPKFKVGDHIRISKFKNAFAKGYTPNWSEEIFVVKKIKNTVPWTYIINDLNGEQIVGSFYEKELEKTNQKEFRIEKVIKRKRNKMYVK